jgi:DNA primase
VGFGGRLLEGGHAPTGAAKYVNSPDSALYHKGSLLYNFHRAKTDVSRSGRAILVEGYTDVIALDQAGVAGVVATCGTALGEDHLRLVARFAERLVLAFDSDEAGARAAERAYQFHQAYQLDIAVLVLPQGQDPADFVLAAGADAGAAFADMAGRAVPLVEYMIRRSLVGRDLRDVEERSRAVRSGLAYVVPLESPVRRGEYARILAGVVGEPENSVLLEMERMLDANEPQSSAPVQRASRGRMPPDEEVEFEALKLMVQWPDLCSGRWDTLTPDRFAKPTHRRVYELIVEDRTQGTAEGVSSLVARAHDGPGGDQIARLLGALAVEPVRTGGQPSPEYAEQVFLRLEEFSLKRRADAVRKELQRLNPLKAPTDHESLFEELIQLESARRRARAAAEAVGLPQ